MSVYQSFCSQELGSHMNITRDALDLTMQVSQTIYRDLPDPARPPPQVPRHGHAQILFKWDLTVQDPKTCRNVFIVKHVPFDKGTVGILLECCGLLINYYYPFCLIFSSGCSFVRYGIFISKW